MPTVREFFLVEAKDCLDRIHEVLAAANGSAVDANELLRVCRILRGSAQMAREEEVARATQALEAVARALLSRVFAWDAGAQAAALETAGDLRALVQRGEPDGDAAARTTRVLDRWRQAGIQLPAAAAGAKPIAGGGAAATPATPEFRAFAAREVAGILAELDAAIPGLEREPRGRDRLKAILRRQRKLLGAQPLEALPVVGQTLRTIDEVCRLIARLDVAVEGAWLDAFRSARDVLAGAAASLRETGGQLDPSAFARLRTLRDGLFERYGELEEPRRAPLEPAGDSPAEVADFFRTEARLLLDRIERMTGDLATATPERQAVLRRELIAALSALRDTAETFGFADAARLAAAAHARARGSTAAEVLALLPEIRERVAADGPATHAQAAASAVVPIQSLFYRGEAALRRALELRPVLERAAAGDPAGRDALEELFDLLRVNLS